MRIYFGKCNVWRFDSRRHLTDILLEKGTTFSASLTLFVRAACVCCGVYCLRARRRARSSWLRVQFLELCIYVMCCKLYIYLHLSHFSSTRCGVNAFDKTLTCNVCTVVVCSALLVLRVGFIVLYVYSVAHVTPCRKAMKSNLKCRHVCLEGIT